MKQTMGFFLLAIVAYFLSVESIGGATIKIEIEKIFLIIFTLIAITNFISEIFSHKKKLPESMSSSDI